MKLKRLISITLIFSLILTLIPISPKSVYADGYITGSGAGYGRVTNDKPGQNWSSSFQGVRVSIVDKNGNNVLERRGLGYSGIDIVFNDPGFDFINGGQFRNKFDTINGVYKRYNWSAELKGMMEEAAKSHPMERVQQFGKELGTSNRSIPPPMLGGNSITANGLKTKQFFISGELASNITIGSQSITPINAGELVISSASGGYVKTSGNLFI